MAGCGSADGDDGSDDGNLATGVSADGNTGVATSADGTVGGSGDSGTTSTPTSPDSDDGDDDDDAHGISLDVLEIPDFAGVCAGGGLGGSRSFSYIWIANSSQGTVSKINTQSLVEEGRYYTSQFGTGSPSRTSVNLSGDVAVANRNGGITKVYADLADCQDTNGTPGIQTSLGANDILAWGEDECIAWHSPMTYGSQRPIAWTQGTFSEAGCSWSDQKVWTTGTTIGGTADVLLLNGDDGSVEQMVNIPNLSFANTFGGYGAVVDSEGNLWFNEMLAFGQNLVRVSLADLSYDIIPTDNRSGYGIAIDEMGRLFTCGGGAVNRYDPVAGTWASTPLPALTYGGCMVDGEDRLWVSGGNNAPYTFKAFDIESMMEVESFVVSEHLHGVSIDFEGYVWGVGGTAGIGGGERALRIDPATGDFETVEGLVGAYTYSDMTGFALVGSTTPRG